jgi:hypothetical protein
LASSFMESAKIVSDIEQCSIHDSCSLL